MKLSFGAVLAFAAAVLAQPRFTNSVFDVEEGEPFTLTWENAEGPVTITVVEGPQKDLQAVTVITSSGSDGAFTWTPSDLPSGEYAFEIIDDTGVKNWSKRFQYTGTGTVTSTEAPTSTAESSTSTEESTSTSTSETETETSTTSEEASTTTMATSTTAEAQTSTSATSTPTGSPPDLNNGQRFASPLGFVLVTVAALVFFN